ncbi:MAG: PTS system mannose/fructose/sorbose family transporter subunit IID [Clostridiales Family XIII bacterium]|jgi:mannose/fructose/N-acetylgalactosamine-specific phosphotransferase system component IID|nr:PTS system mannose/fructose/sorbose family transporter subunit IID [Clostridiales Family XIII bacterium]
METNETKGMHETGEIQESAGTKGGKLLTKRDITKSWLLWYLACEVSNSFERLQSIAFCICMGPILKKLYPDKEDYCAALTRHLQFFNTQGIWGGIVHGITIALEEERAKGAKDITDETITGIKTGLMGPFAGIGDTIDFATVLPIILAFFIPIAQDGNWIAGVLPITIFTIITGVEGYSFWHLGYKAGTASATQILQAGWIKQLILGASVLGLFMMGGLSASLVKVSTSLKITAGGMNLVVQDILDQILPGLLPLLTVGGAYLFLTLPRKSGKKVSFIVLVVAILIIGLVLGALGILG